MHTEVMKNRQGPVDDTHQRLRRSMTTKLAAIPNKSNSKTHHEENETYQHTGTGDMQTQRKTVGQRSTDDSNQSLVKTLNKGIATIPNKGGKDEEYTATLGRPSPPIEVAMEQTNEGQTKTDMTARQEETLIKKAKGLKKSVTRENPERNMQLSSRAKKRKRKKMTDKEQKATKQS